MPVKAAVIYSPSRFESDMDDLLFGYDGGRLRKDAMRRPRVIPPVYFLAAVAVMVPLHGYLPLHRLISRPWNWVGLVPMAIGAMMSGWAVATFIRRRTTIRPGHVPTGLVTHGPFVFTRNPMYLSLTLMLAGLAMLLGSLSPWLVLPLFILAIGHNIIPAEEATMTEAFGDEYRKYQERVRRWI
jgi:protein-S-isoprenylcysteine O-methyltransferase Ste14